jgi:hypothetical protein
MLTLFLMLGATYLVAASRARDAAKAYARLTFGSDEARIPAPALLDSVLMRVMRGPIVIGTGTFESLLADKYGGPTTSGTPTLSGSLSSISRTGPVLTGTLATSASVRSTDLAGRVLTLSQPGRPVTSHRIVRAVNSGSTNVAGTAFTVAIDLPYANRPFTLLSGTVAVIVNGREFSGVPSISPPSNENWDGFDEHNQFLAQLHKPPSVAMANTPHKLAGLVHLQLSMIELHIRRKSLLHQLLDIHSQVHRLIFLLSMA